MNLTPEFAHRPEDAGRSISRGRALRFARSRISWLTGLLWATGVAVLMVSPGFVSGGISGPVALPVRQPVAIASGASSPAASPSTGTGAVPLATAPSFGWRLLSTGSAPSPRFGAASVYDAADGYVLLVGGTDGSTYFNDSWALRGNMWTALPPGPSAFAGRAFASIAFDPYTRSVLLFGGLTAAGSVGSLWSFQAGAWTLLPVSGPSARHAAAMTFDDNLGALVLFGGSSGSAALSDTWSFANGTWSPVVVASGPQGRANASFVYDSAYARAILFGGRNGSTSLNDTWKLGPVGWTQLTLTGPAPPPLSQIAATYDDSDALLLYFGGVTQGGFPSNRSWALTNQGTWEANFTPNGPTPRSASTAAFDQSGARVVLFGGFAGSPTNDTWWFSMAGPNRTWFKVVTATAPDQRTQGAFAWDAADGYMVLFGGENHSATSNAGRYFNDTWTFRRGVWKELTLPVHPSGRRGAMMAYDAYDGYTVLFGGTNVTSALNDTWVFQRGIWHQVVTPVAPVGRRSGGFTYDTSDGYVLLFGGHNGTQANFSTYAFFNDTWSYRAGVWTRLAPATHPGPRAEPQMEYYPPIGKVVLYAGYYNNTTGRGEMTENDTWTFVGGAWTNLTSLLLVHPGTRDGGAFVFDEKRGDLMLFGGDLAVLPLPDVWLFTTSGWVEDCATCALPGYATDHAAYDPLEGGVLAFGTGPHQVGLGPGQTWLNLTALDAATLVSPTVADAGVPVGATTYAFGGTLPYVYHWAFDDGFTGAGRAIRHPLSAPGAHALSLNVTDSVHLTTSIPYPLTTVADPTVAPTASVSPTDNLTLELVANQSGGVAPFVSTWTFGDGTNGTGLVINHTFAAGTYTPVVRLVDSFGFIATGSVGPLTLPETKLVVRLSPSQSSGWAPVAVNISATPSGGNAPFSYRWSATNATVVGTGANATVRATSAGASSVEVTVTDRFGASANATAAIAVASPLVPTIQVVSAAASCSGSTPSGDRILLNATSVGGFSPVTYRWEVGTVVRAGANVSVDVPYARVVNVSLKATDAQGLSSNTSLPVTVGTPSCSTTSGGGFAFWFDVAAFVVLAILVVAVVVVWRKPHLGRRRPPGPSTPPE